jgi:hypothetical protein
VALDPPGPVHLLLPREQHPPRVAELPQPLRHQSGKPEPNQPQHYNCGPAISRDKYEPLTFPGRKVFLTWDDPGRPVGPNNSYITSTTAGEPKFVAWVSQLNTTYTELTTTGKNEGFTFQPASEVYETDPALNGTAFIALTDSNPYVTPYNLTMLNPNVRALGLYQAG